MLALVRHAHAGEKRLWEGPDDLRPLSVRGRQQADGVAENLRPIPVTTLLSSPYVRCLQTLGPLAARLGLPIGTDDLLRPDARAADLDLLLDDPRLEGAVLCTHGETLNALFDLWHHRRVLSASAEDRDSGRGSTEKGATWIVEVERGHRTVHYLSPLHVGPALHADAGAWT